MNRIRKIAQDFSNLFQKVPLDEQINFARHLSIVVNAGMPLVEGLKVIKKQASSKTLEKIIDDLASDVNSGHFLADSLEKYDHVFGHFFVNIVRVGESSGTLAQNLAYLAGELKKDRDLKRKVRSALIYPIIIMVVTIAVVGFLAFFLFPKLLPVFAGLDAEVPVTTRILIASSDFVRNYGLHLLGGLVLLAALFKFVVARVGIVRYILHRTMLYIPVLSGVVVSVNAATFSRILALLLKSGVRIVSAIDITGKTLKNEAYSRAFEDAREGIRKGGQLADHLSHDERLFPPLLAGMVGVGESTGNLEDNLMYLSEYYTEEVENTLDQLTTLLEPLLLLLMGALVGFVAISIILPIYQLSSSVS